MTVTCVVTGEPRGHREDLVQHPPFTVTFIPLGTGVMGVNAPCQTSHAELSPVQSTTGTKTRQWQQGASSGWRVPRRSLLRPSHPGLPFPFWPASRIPRTAMILEQREAVFFCHRLQYHSMGYSTCSHLKLFALDKRATQEAFQGSLSKLYKATALPKTEAFGPFTYF